MTVYLVGAGPGDPGLLTVRAAELLARADVVMYDRLASSEFLKLAPKAAIRISVGKQPEGHSTPQDEINELLARYGSTHDVVVRLKGGDPYVFARGAEEFDALRAAGIEVEVVPGITSAIAALSYGGIPVTRRYSSTSFTVVTGHEDPTKARSEVNWEAIAAVGGTIVILMGVANIDSIATRLIAGGLSAETPAAAVRWGTRSQQETTRSTLGTLGAQGLAAPSVIVIGDVARDDLDWFTTRPLFGRSIVVTRAPEQASRLTTSLAELGAEVVGFPTIAIKDPPNGSQPLIDAVQSLGRYDWVVLTSPNGAERFLDAVGDLRKLAGTQVAVIGPGTSASVARRSLEPDLVPDRYVAEGLLEVFPAVPAAGGTVLLAHAAGARPVLADGLRAMGWRVDEVVTYETVAAVVDPDDLGCVAAADAVAFASSSAVTAFAAAVERSQWPPVALAIGPITAATATELGFDSVVTAATHDIDGLCTAAVTWAGAPL